MSSACPQPGCKNMALLALPSCDFCQKRHCTAHMFPEVHGCGDACKNSAQRQATADAAAQRKARKHVGQDDAKKRLDKRLEEGEAQRRKKAPASKK